MTVIMNLSIQLFHPLFYLLFADIVLNVIQSIHILCRPTKKKKKKKHIHEPKTYT